MSDELKISKPPGAAAGVTAVVRSLREAVAKVGLFEGPALLLRSNQIDHFDCPGCAWPEELHQRKIFDFCENGAKAVADEATTRRVTREFFAGWPVDELAGQSDRWLNDQGRLTEPMILREGERHYRPVSWDDAFRHIADELRALPSPEHAAFYTSGRTSNEAAFLYQLFVRRFGTNNLPDCSNLCHESSGFALNAVLGSGKGSVTLADFVLADAIFVIGQNPGSNHPRMLATLQAAKRRGATIVAINPLDEVGLKRFKNPQEIAGVFGRGTGLADLTVRIRVNGDLAAFKAINRYLLEWDRAGRGVLDRVFIDEHTSGFQECAADLLAMDADALVAASGAAPVDIRRAAEIVAGSARIICCWAMGITQHHNAVATIQEIVNLLLLRGSVGKPGAGVCPVRGHSNVQGDRTMGIWERPSSALLDALENEFGFVPPKQPGYDSVDALAAMHAGKLRVFFAMGGNFARAMPDLEFTRGALRRCKLTVQVSTKLNRSHVLTGGSAIILPTLGRTELDQQNGIPQFVTIEDSMGAVRSSRGRRSPASADLRSEPAIVAGLAQALFGEDEKIDWPGLAADYALIRERIAHVIPGFENFQARIAERGEFLLPHAVRDQRKFSTASGAATFTRNALQTIDVPAGHYLMTTLRSHDQFNTTIYSDDDRYRGIRGGRQVLFMNLADIGKEGWVSGQAVSVHSHFNGVTRTVGGITLVAYDIPRGCVAGYYPEMNALIAFDHVAARSNTPAYKSVVVSILAD